MNSSYFLLALLVSTVITFQLVSYNPIELEEHEDALTSRTNPGLQDDLQGGGIFWGQVFNKWNDRNKHILQDDLQKGPFKKMMEWMYPKMKDGLQDDLQLGQAVEKLERRRRRRYRRQDHMNLQ